MLTWVVLEQLAEAGAARRQQDAVRLHRVTAVTAESDVQQLAVLSQLVKHGRQSRAELIPAQTELLSPRHRLSSNYCKMFLKIGSHDKSGGK